jgi:hypothetical protein
LLLLSNRGARFNAPTVPISMHGNTYWHGRGGETIISTKLDRMVPLKNGVLGGGGRGYKQLTVSLLNIHK